MTSNTRKTQPKKLAGSARDLAGQVEDVVKGTAREAYRTVDSMPVSQRKQMATISLAVGGLLFVIGAPRLLTFLAFLPALAVGGLKVARRAG
jgi:hypothetical protein